MSQLLRAHDDESLVRIGEILRNAEVVGGTLMRRRIDAMSPEVWRRSRRPSNGLEEYRVAFWHDVCPDQANALLSKHGAVKLSRGTNASARPNRSYPFVDVYMVSGVLSRLAGSELVELIELPPRPELANIDSSALSRGGESDVGPATPYDLTGDGVVVGVWDSGLVRDTHLDLQNASSGSPISNGSKRVRLMETSGSFTDHATHVCGTIVGDGASLGGARGFAPRGYALSYDWNNVHEQQRSARHQYRISADNHSYGGALGSTAVQTSDIAIRDIWLNMCKAAGNSGPGDGTIGASAGMKNSYTVAAVEDGGAVASFSSRGPIDDGRLIPHFSANGVQLTSTVALSGLSHDEMSGTSMASPSVCGTIALLTELWYREMRGRQFAPDTCRGILAATALDAGNPGPDYQYGFGIVDCQRAADLILADSASGGKQIVRGTIRPAEVIEYELDVPSSTPVLKVVCSWLDIHASSSAAVKLVNDIDLELVEPGGTIVHYPWSGLTSGTNGSQTHQWTRHGPNQRDNIELVEVENPVSGTWKVRVRGANIPPNPHPTVPNDATGFVLVSEGEFNTSQETFEDGLNTSGPVGIPDDDTNGVVRTFSVGSPQVVRNVRLYANLRHPRRGDLDVYITHPNSSTVAQVETSGPSDLADIIAVYPDTRQNADDPNAFIGLPANGTWEVRIVDSLAGNTGSIDYLALELDYGPVNLPPVADAGADQSTYEGLTANVSASGSTDPNGDMLEYQWDQLSGPTVSIANPQGIDASFVAPQVATAENVVLQVTVGDGHGYQDTDEVDITILSSAPVITSTPVTNAAVGSPYTYTLSATGFPAPSFSVSGNPAWLGLSGDVLSGTPGASDFGVTPGITITASNGQVNDDVQVFQVQVEGVPPQIASVPVTSAKQGKRYNYEAQASGVPAPSLSVGTLPAWMGFNPSSGVLTGTPGSGDVGISATVTITAYNGQGTDTVQSFSVQVMPKDEEDDSDNDDDGGCASRIGALPCPAAILALLLTIPILRRRRASL